MDHLFFVDGVGDLRDDDLLLAVGLFDGRLAAKMDGAAARLIELYDGVDALDDAARREVRAGQPAHQFADGNARVVDEGDGRVDDFAEIVRRDVGGHADADAGAAVDEDVREAGGQDGGLDARLVEVGEHVHGVFFKIRKKLFRKAFETAFRVTVGGGRVAVDGTEVALAFDERAAHVEILRHAGQRVIDGLVAVGMVVTDDFADDFRALFRLVRLAEAEVVHGPENTAVAGLQTVAHIRNGASNIHGQ